MKIDIAALQKDELTAQLQELGMPKYKGLQVFRWIHQRQAQSFDEMTDVSKKDRAMLEERFVIPTVSIAKKLESSLDGTVKYLFELADGNRVEAVIMRYKHGNSICISTQVGCKMGCDFCASTIAGFVRHLRASEMLQEIYKAMIDLGEPIASVVLMGVGEPLDNFENTVSFLRLLSESDGLGLSLRHVSLSTSGLADKILDLAQEHFPLTLSISLHAPNDEIRNKLMPVNKKWPLHKLMEACRVYGKTTGRRISFEYIMIDGVNDSDECALLLSRLLKGIIAHVNLIPANPVRERPYKPSKRQRIDRFEHILAKNNIAVTVRRKMGADINAACGQLRRDYNERNGQK